MFIPRNASMSVDHMTSPISGVRRLASSESAQPVAERQLSWQTSVTSTRCRKSRHHPLALAVRFALSACRAWQSSTQLGHRRGHRRPTEKRRNRRLDSSNRSTARSRASIACHRWLHPGTQPHPSYRRRRVAGHRMVSVTKIRSAATIGPE